MENQFIQQVNTFRTLQVHKAGYIDQELGGIAVTADQVTMQSIQMVNTAGMGGLEGQITYASEPVDVAIRIDALGVTVTTQPNPMALF